ncbi:MAG: ribbon-helix-helix domain-containing protein [Qipengyuania sp.]
MPTPYHPPVKRSVEIAGHKTSVSLEPLFWDMLREAAAREEMSVNALVARIDAERIRAATPPGLAGAIRVWLVARLRDGERGDGERGDGERGDEFAPAAPSKD